MQNDLIRREGAGISLFINKESNYGLSEYKPMDKNDPRYKSYINNKIMLKDPTFCKIICENSKRKVLTRKQTEAFIHCLGCKTLKINNYERYCSLCSDFWRKVKD